MIFKYSKIYHLNRLCNYGFVFKNIYVIFSLCFHWCQETTQHHRVITGLGSIDIIITSF